MPGRDWSNATMAGFYLTQFNEGVALAKSRVEAEYGQPERVVTYGGI